MEHLRNRHCESVFNQLLKYSPIVGLFGHRQVGKTTFCESQGGRYETLDQRKTRLAIVKDPDRFVAQFKGKPNFLDECQLEPDLFPALKDYVRVHPAPGKFVLTGSVRFSSRKAIRESLTGRIATVEMLPLVLSELEPRPLPLTIPGLLRLKQFSEETLETLPDLKALKTVQKTFDQYLAQGGLPKIAFTRDARIRNDLVNDLLSTILDRDLRLVLETTLSLEVLKDFLRELARMTGQVWNASRVRRETGLAFETQKNLLFAMESIYLIRRIPVLGRKGFLILMEDQFEEFSLSGGQLPSQIQLLSAFYRNVRAQFNYVSGSEVQYSSYWTADGARVPLVIQGASPHLQGILGIHFLVDPKPNLSQIRSSNSFLRKFPEAKVIFATRELGLIEILDSRSMIAPLAALL